MKLPPTMTKYHRQPVAYNPNIIAVITTKTATQSFSRQTRHNHRHKFTRVNTQLCAYN